MTLDPVGDREACCRPAAGEAERMAGLQGAVRGVERGRGTVRQASPEEALMLWKGLAEGRWTLIDHLESDGRRLLLTRRNASDRPGPRALTAREREVLALAAFGHSDKYIGYLLGLTAGTVAGHLAATRAKLGLKTRRELIAFAAAAGLAGAGGRPGPPPEEEAARGAGTAEP